MEKRYDAMLLLGLELGEGDQPEEELIRRAETAAKAYHEGMAPVIVACGGRTPGHRISEAEVMKTLLEKQGVPAQAILLENKSQDTMQNFRYAAKLLGGARGKRVLVVTSDYHVFRSVLTARRVGFCARGYAAELVRGEVWKKKRREEYAYTFDLIMGWQDEGKSRPQWTYKLFDAVFGKKKKE